jgi:hypothetical protein
VCSYFISNPDLPRRLALGAPLNRYNRDLFYAQSDEGAHFWVPAVPRRGCTCCLQVLACSVAA